MTDFPLPRVLEFLRGVTPFDTLDPAELTEVASRMEMGYFPRGEVVLKQGGPASGYLYIIQHGSARVTVDDGQGGEILVDVRGEGDFFGALSLLKGLPGPVRGAGRRGPDRPDAGGRAFPAPGGRPPHVPAVLRRVPGAATSRRCARPPTASFPR